MKPVIGPGQALARQHGDPADHARLKVPGDQAGKLELAGPVEMPQHLRAAALFDMGHVGLVVLHVRELRHQRRMLGQFGGRADHHLMQQPALVADAKAHRLAQPHGDAVRREAHVVGHRDVDGAPHVAGLTGDAPVFLLLFHGAWRLGMGTRGVGAGQHRPCRSAGQKQVSETITEKAMAARDRIIDSLYRQAENDPRSNLAPALAREIRKQGLSGTGAEALNWLLGVEFPLDLGASPPQLSLEGFNEGDEWDGGPDLLIKGGASQLVDKIAAGTTVETGVEVSSIKLGRSSVEVRTRSGSVVRADGCVVTVPLGVLKAGGVRFDPPLPTAKRRAISRIGFGLLDKVFFSYNESWWPTAANQLGMIGAPLANTVSVFPLSRLTGTPLAVGLTGGPYAAGLEKAGPNAMTAAVIERLLVGFGTTAKPTESEQTNWRAERFTRGSYSYLGPGAGYADRVALGKLDRRLILAGEHTSIDRPATMDGAWLAGKTAARRLAAALS